MFSVSIHDSIKTEAYFCRFFLNRLNMIDILEIFFIEFIEIETLFSLRFL